jgi:hypothetical protein
VVSICRGENIVRASDYLVTRWHDGRPAAPAEGQRSACIGDDQPGTVPDPAHGEPPRPPQPSPDQPRPAQTRPAQTRPGQTRPDHTIPGQARPGQASHTRPARAMPSHLTSQPASHTSSARANQACLQSHFADTSYFTGGWPLWQDGHDCNPSYLICGGLVFVPLTLPWCLIICAPTKDTPARFRPPSLRNAGRSILPR